MAAGREHEHRPRPSTATLLSTGEVLVAGGRAGTTLSSGAERYDPVGDTWRTVPDLSIPRLEHTATLLNDGRVLVAGGFDGSGTGNGVSSAELYTRQPPVPTTLTVPPVVHLTLVGLQIALPFKATLTRSSDGAAIAGKTVSFATGAGPACSDTTNAQGVASCTFTVSRLLGVVLGLGYSAAFGGDDDYVGSSARAASSGDPSTSTPRRTPGRRRLARPRSRPLMKRPAPRSWLGTGSSSETGRGRALNGHMAIRSWVWVELR